MRISSLITLALVSMALVARAHADAAGDLLAGCKSTATDPTEQRWRCGDHSLGVLPVGAAVTEKRFLEVMTKFFVAKGAQVAPASVVVGGELRSGLRAHVPARDGAPATFSSMVAVPAPDGTLLEVFCESTSATRCDTRMRDLAIVVMAGGLAPPKSAPSGEARDFAGRMLTPPRGCLGSGQAGRTNFKCPSGSLWWTTIGDGRAMPPIALLLQEKKRSLVAEGRSVSERRTACAVDGTAVECGILEFPRHDGKHVVFVAAIAGIRDRNMFVMCEALLTNGALSPPCSSLIELR